MLKTLNALGLNAPFVRQGLHTPKSLFLDFISGTLDPRVTFTRASTATFTGSNGLIQSAAIDAPRFTYDPVTLQPLGLLIEEQRSNLVTYSEDFTNVLWIKTATTVSANATVSPDGTSNADKVVETAITNEHNVTQVITFVSGTTYTATVYAKQSERNFIVLAFGSAAFGSATRAWFNLSNGTVGTLINSPTATITPVGNGWYRCSITKTATATAASNNIMQVSNADNVLSYTGDGTSGLFIFGAQLEAAAFATSYIPTVASQVTRSADNAVMTGTNFSSWYNASEGTMFVDYVRNGLSSTGPFALDDTTGNNSIRFVFGAASPAQQRFDVTTAAVQQAALVFTAAGQVGINYKTAAAYKLNDIAGVQNSGTVIVDSTATIPVVTQAQIGRTIGAVFTGTIKQISYYPQRLPDSQLQTLTS